MSFARRYGVELALIAVLLLAVLYFAYLAFGLLPGREARRDFKGDSALADVGKQLAYGTRAVGTQSNVRLADSLVEQLTALGWDVVIQEFVLSDALKGRNLIAYRSPRDDTANTSAAPVGLITAHYDTRLAADQDATAQNQTRPATGANSGAAGAAILMELARALDVDAADQTICLAFTDADANIGIPGWRLAAGSTHLAQTLARDVPQCANPAWVVALGLAGGVDATFVPAQTDNTGLQQQLWSRAQALGYSDTFQPSGSAESPPVSPFAGSFPTATISDAAYPWAATMADTPDKVSADTLERVGRTLETWIEGTDGEP